MRVEVRSSLVKFQQVLSLEGDYEHQSPETNSSSDNDCGEGNGGSGKKLVKVQRALVDLIFVIIVIRYHNQDFQSALMHIVRK